MRKIKEVLRLHFELGLGQRQIARCCSIGQSTVSRLPETSRGGGAGVAAAAGVGRRPARGAAVRAAAGRAGALLQGGAGLRRRPRGAPTHKHVTLQLIWQEYRGAASGRLPATAGSASCTGAGARKLDVCMRQEHRAGEKLFVDYCGATVPVVDPRHGRGAARRRCSWRCGAPAATPTPRPRGARAARLDRLARAGLRVLRRRAGAGRFRTICAPA